jgi:hypothetical protein
MLKYKALVVIIFSFLFFACGKKSPVREPGGIHYQSYQSSCKDGSEIWTSKITQSGSSILSSHGDTIFVTQRDVLGNCCSRIEVNVARTSSGFDLRQKDVGKSCNCTCLFDLKTILCGLAEGSYFVRIFDPDGNLIGSGSVDIPQKFSFWDTKRSKFESTSG